MEEQRGVEGQQQDRDRQEMTRWDIGAGVPERLLGVSILWGPVAGMVWEGRSHFKEAQLLHDSGETGHITQKCCSGL